MDVASGTCRLLAPPAGPDPSSIRGRERLRTVPPVRASSGAACDSRQRSLGPDRDVSQGKGRDIGRPGSENRCAVGFQRRSKRSRFMTLTHAFAKSCTNFCSASSVA